MAPPTIPPAAAARPVSIRNSGASAPPVTSLSHPLPAGMRDLLPSEAALQGRLVGRILESFQLVGYERVALPVFEYADVLARGLGAVPPSTLLRFVEPETGEVVALRPDMTPQVARLAATRLPEGPFPARLCYRGSVLRRRHERARHEQQVMQAGIELIGVRGMAADAEVVETITRAVRVAGLDEFVLDLGHGALAHELLTDLDTEAKRALVEALSLKDQVEVVRRAEQAGLPPERVKELSAVVGLQGGREVFEAARKVLSTGRSLAYVEEVEALYDELVRRAVAPRIVVDLGELRAVEYYTGAMFQVLAEGPGQAVASGGRYDTLLEAFGPSLPAAGGAIHVDHLRWAIGPQKQNRPLRVLVVAEHGLDAVEAVARSIRAAGIVAGTWSPTLESPGGMGENGPLVGKALDYARAWRYSHVVRIDPASASSLSLGHVPDDDQEANSETLLGAMQIEDLIERLKA